MPVYDKNGTELPTVYDTNGTELPQAYNLDGNELISKYYGRDAYVASHSERNLYAGGLIEVQPDSWDGTTVCVGDIVQPTDPTAWGFPQSLSKESKASIKNEIFRGNGFGVSFIRLPMGFGYRGYRNIDPVTGLARNIGQRFEGQNAQLKSWFSNISQAGGGLDVEYWCLAPHWLTGGAYYNADVENYPCAGWPYPQNTTLESIKASDPTQYAKQIDELTDAIVNDLEYVHQNVAPVRMYTLGAEPSHSGQLKYGHCRWNDGVYNDVFAVLHPKVMASSILAEYNGEKNEVLMHLCANNGGWGIGSSTITNHADWIWGFSHDTNISAIGNGGADRLKDSNYPIINDQSRKNVFICEYEYFNTNFGREMAFSNNVVRMIFEMLYGKAKTIMPLIHVCKPTNQSSSQTNTVGYCLYAVDMNTGDYTVNTWAYNSWKMFNDNLPIGAEVITGGDGGLEKAGYIVLEHEGISYLLMGNYSSAEQTLTVVFDSSKTFSGKLYNLTNLGTAQEEVSGLSITFAIPAYSGLVYVEE